MASKRRSNTLTRFFEDIVDDTKDFVDDLLDRAKDIETDVKDAVTDVTDDDEGSSSAEDTAALRRSLKDLQAKVDQLTELQLQAAKKSD
jgi:polyhydroxyalkanoate synthesis regulator phasin